MYTIEGEPQLNANGHDVFAEMHRVSAADLRKAAGEMPQEEQGLLVIAARQDGAAAGHAFRAEELRYDARGGMTAAQAARRFEPGAPEVST